MSAIQETDSFRPPAHRAPTTFVDGVIFFCRRQLDLQVATVYADVLRFSKTASGKVVDFGAGLSPYRHLFQKPGAQYMALDWVQAGEFLYKNPDAITYSGDVVPLPDGSADSVLSTEVFEHLPDPHEKAQELLRILKPGGALLITVPWSARYHYQPHDYYRFTPTTLKRIFAGFDDVRISPRGTDVVVVCSKTIVILIRFLVPRSVLDLWKLPFAPFAAVGILAFGLMGRFALALGLGSTDDPLGYTVTARKKAS